MSDIGPGVTITPAETDKRADDVSTVSTAAAPTSAPVPAASDAQHPLSAELAGQVGAVEDKVQTHESLWSKVVGDVESFLHSDAGQTTETLVQTVARHDAQIADLLAKVAAIATKVGVEL